jgi:hypothetical protein
MTDAPDHSPPTNEAATTLDRQRQDLGAALVSQLVTVLPGLGIHAPASFDELRETHFDLTAIALRLWTRIPKPDPRRFLDLERWNPNCADLLALLRGVRLAPPLVKAFQDWFEQEWFPALRRLEAAERAATLSAGLSRVRSPLDALID